MIVGAGNDAEPMAGGEEMVERIPGPASAFGMPDIGIWRAVVLGTAPFGIDLDDGRDLGVKMSEICASVAQAVRGMMGDHYGASLPGEFLEAAEVVDPDVLGIGRWEEDVVVAEAG